MEVKTNNSFAFFANSYRRFAKELENRGINLYNCTEGGMFWVDLSTVHFQNSLLMK